MTKIILRDIPATASQHLLESGYSSILAKIFASRGITDNKQLSTSFVDLLPFDKLKNSREMARLMADAITTQKKIVVIADYDADGATACAVAMRGLRTFGAQVDFIVPNRFEYGYGLTPEIVHLASQIQPDILLTVDNGIASVDGVAEANHLGMQVLITDHHLPSDTLPDAACIVNPNQPGCTFPSKNLAGVGVMFYVLVALRAELRARGTFHVSAEPKLANLLDLVALGTIADVVRLDQNNRILVQQGLLRIRAGQACAGINALLHVAKKDTIRTSSQDLGFAIGPRLNAAGRLDDMTLGINCLLTDEPTVALSIATKLDSLNRERRSIETEMQESALAAFEKITNNSLVSQKVVSDTPSATSLVLFDEGWHQGVIGILASRLKDKFHRPTIAFARSNNGEIKGSGRSITGLHLRDTLDIVSKKYPALIKSFGGHAAAAGLSIAEDDFNIFVDIFEKTTSDLLSSNDLMKHIETDGMLDHNEMNLEIAQSLQEQVWGQGFPAPQFINHFIVKNQRVVAEKHLKLKLEVKNRTIDAILFGYNEALPNQIQAVYSLDINEYKGNSSVQLIIRHWKESDQFPDLG